jgi:hypothetical protein
MHQSARLQDREIQAELHREIANRARLWRLAWVRQAHGHDIIRSRRIRLPQARVIACGSKEVADLVVLLSRVVRASLDVWLDRAKNAEFKL